VSNLGEVGKTRIFLAFSGNTRKWCEIRPKLLLITNRKLLISFRLAPRVMTLDNLELP